MKSDPVSALEFLQGSHQLSDMAFSTDMNKRAIPHYTMKKLDTAVYIDVRPYKSAYRMQYSVARTKKYLLVEGIGSFASEIHLYPCFTTWIVITIRVVDKLIIIGHIILKCVYY